MSGYIYLIKLREFNNIKESTYKIGRSCDISRRHKEYPKDSILLYSCIVNNEKKLEPLLLDEFRLKFIQKKQYGTEYFSGNYIKMVQVINEIINKYDDIVLEPELNIIESYHHLKQNVNQLIDDIMKKELIMSKYISLIQFENEDINNLITLNTNISFVLSNINEITNDVNPINEDKTIEYPCEYAGHCDTCIESTKIKLFCKEKCELCQTFRIEQKRSISYEDVKMEFEKKHFKCLAKSNFYEINNNEYIIRKKNDLIAAYEHLTFNIHDVKSQFIYKWLKDSSMRTYQNVTFAPPPVIVNDGCFNLWNGFRIEKVTIPESTNIINGLDLFLDHIHLVVGEEQYCYVVRWFAMLCQKPGIRPEVMILIKSKQGLGKELIYKIFKAIIGDKYCVCTESVEQDILGGHNGLIEGKLLFVLNEMDIQLSVKLSGQIKNFITNEPNKNINQFVSNNFNHTLSFSNKCFPLTIEESDRCSNPINRSMIDVPNREYFTKLYAILKDDYVLNQIYKYFLSVDISKFNAKDDRPNTQFCKDLKEMSRSRELQFLIDYSYRSIKAPDILFINLFNEFNKYNTENYVGSIYKTSNILFSNKIKNLHIPGIDTKRLSNGNMFIFDWLKINMYFQEMGY